MHYEALYAYMLMHYTVLSYSASAEVRGDCYINYTKK
uniref:Uncharacterized protein n=1 Tax=Setaria italica TaxID=4555 RepID=K4A4F2_SETIT